MCLPLFAKHKSLTFYKFLLNVDNLKTFLAFNNLWYKHQILLMMLMQPQRRLQRLFVRHQGRLQNQQPCSMDKLRLATTLGNAAFKSTWRDFSFGGKMKINTVAIATKHKLKPFSMRVMQSSRLTFFWTLPANDKNENEHEAQSRRSYSDIFSDVVIISLARWLGWVSLQLN